MLNRFFSPLQRNGGGEEPDEVPQALAAADAAPAPPSSAPAAPQVWGWPNFKVLSKRQTTSRVPVFVMLPLDTVTRDGVLTNTKALSVGFAVRP